MIRLFPAIKAAGGGGGSCTTVRDSVTSGTNSGSYPLKFGELIVATKFTATATYTCCKLGITCGRVNTSSDEVWAELYSHNAGSNLPDTLLGASTHILLSDLTTGADLYDFTGINVSITSGTSYWAALRKLTNDNTNYAVVWTQNDGTTRLAVNSGSWSYFADRVVNFTTYST